MNLIDALKTGRRIRIAATPDLAGSWLDPKNETQAGDCIFSIEEVLDDWEVEPEPKKKVKKWLWVLNNGDVRPRFYTDVEWHAECVGGKKLPWSEMEFEE